MKMLYNIDIITTKILFVRFCESTFLICRKLFSAL